MPSPAPAICAEPLPYATRLAARPREAIDLAVIHCTELPDLGSAREYGERLRYPQSNTGDSGHFYIDRDGTLYQWVPLEHVAHHTRGYNARSVGIELVNRGRFPNWLDSRHQAMDEPYTDAQIEALVVLLRWLRVELPALRKVAGHEDLDREEVPASDDPSLKVRRKRDPGALFPWTRVLEAVGLERMI